MTNKKNTVSAGSNIVHASAAPSDSLSLVVDKALAHVGGLAKREEVSTAIGELTAVEVKLQRDWWLPQVGNEFTALLLARSGDVSSLYQNGKEPKKDPDPSYVWAAVSLSEIMIGKGDRADNKGPFTLFYFFEPALLRDRLAQAARLYIPIRAASVAKHEIKSKRYGSVFAWNWKLWNIQFPIEESQKIVDQFVSQAVLPATSEDFSEVIEAEGSTVE